MNSNPEINQLESNLIKSLKCYDLIKSYQIIEYINRNIPDATFSTNTVLSLALELAVDQRPIDPQFIDCVINRTPDILINQPISDLGNIPFNIFLSRSVPYYGQQLLNLMKRTTNFHHINKCDMNSLNICLNNAHVCHYQLVNHLITTGNLDCFNNLDQSGQSPLVKLCRLNYDISVILEIIRKGYGLPLTIPANVAGLTLLLSMIGRYSSEDILAVLTLLENQCNYAEHFIKFMYAKNTIAKLYDLSLNPILNYILTHPVVGDNIEIHHENLFNLINYHNNIDVFKVYWNHLYSTYGQAFVEHLLSIKGRILIPYPVSPPMNLIYQSLVRNDDIALMLLDNIKTGQLSIELVAPDTDSKTSILNILTLTSFRYRKQLVSKILEFPTSITQPNLVNTISRQTFFQFQLCNSYCRSELSVLLQLLEYNELKFQNFNYWGYILFSKNADITPVIEILDGIIRHPNCPKNIDYICRDYLLADEHPINNRLKNYIYIKFPHLKPNLYLTMIDVNPASFDSIVNK